MVDTDVCYSCDSGSGGRGLLIGDDCQWLVINADHCYSFSMVVGDGYL